MMKNTMLAGGAVALIALGALSFLVLKRSHAPSKQSETADGVPAASAYLDAGRRGAPSSLAPAKATVVPKKAQIRQLFEVDSRLVALSPEERAWLERHYYPTQADLERAKKLSDDQLRNGPRDALSLTLFGQRLLERGNTIGAATVLENAASMGSVYAYEEAAIAQFRAGVEAEGGEVSDNQSNALRARLEVAKILGDHRADELIQQYLPTYNLASNARTVQVQTTEFLRQLGSNAQVQGRTMPGPDPRPNAELWADMKTLAQAGGMDEVTVY
jgi:hypothetical protein